MSYFKTVNLNPTAAAVYRYRKSKWQERKEREKLEHWDNCNDDSQASAAKNNAEHWARLRRDYPAIERKA